mgnify:CR=1 FL=1
MRREWTVAAPLLALLMTGGVALAQERPAPVYEERQPHPDLSPAPAAPAPVMMPSAPVAPVSSAQAPSPSFSEDGQARPRSGGSTASSSGSRARGGSSGTSSDNRGRQRSPGTVSSGRSGSGGRSWDASGEAADTSSSAARQRYPGRNRDGSLTTGYAVRRGTVRPPYGGGWYYPSHPWYGSWYPWGLGSWGLGFYMRDPYYYGYYGWGRPYGGYYGYVGRYDDTGALRVQVKPRDAQVFVDGYYVGVVDEFDGAFQRLRLDTGPHRIEIRKEGFETLRFDVRVTFDHTITLRGELRPASPTPEP